MDALHSFVKRSLWLGVGAVAVLAAGCAGMAHSNHSAAALSGAQEVPPVTTGAAGSTDISVSEAKCPSALSGNNCPTVYGTVVTSGINGTSAHIHQGAPGQNGPVIVTLVKVDDNTWAVPSGTTLSGTQNDAYWAGMLYVNVHSDANKGGEIRAQLKP
jgi:CHRD domain